MTIYNEKIKHEPTQHKKLQVTSEAKLFPKMVVINAIFPCNALCPHCPYTASTLRKEPRAKEFPWISEEIFKSIADQTGQYQATLRISGAGEPMLHPQMVDLIVYAKSVGCKVGLINNGSLMNEENARRLLEAKTEMIEFSVDAADPDTYDIVRKGLNFEKTVANIKKTVELRNKLSPETTIIASVVNQKIVEDKIDSIVAFWDAIVDKVQVRKYLTWDINDLKDSADVAAYLEADDTPCPIPFDRLLIDTNGDIRFCIYDIKAQTTWGNVLKEPISEVWTGKNFEWLRQIHNDGEYQKMKICSTCLDRQFRSWNYNYFHLRETAKKRKEEKIHQS